MFAKETLIDMKNKARTAMVPITGTAVALGSTVLASASDGGSASLPTFSITEEMLSPLVEGVTANIGVILPVGLGLFAIFLGIRLIPNIIRNFTHS